MLCLVASLTKFSSSSSSSSFGCKWVRRRFCHVMDFQCEVLLILTICNHLRKPPRNIMSRATEYLGPETTSGKYVMGERLQFWCWKCVTVKSNITVGYPSLNFRITVEWKWEVLTKLTKTSGWIIIDFHFGYMVGNLVSPLFKGPLTYFIEGRSPSRQKWRFSFSRYLNGTFPWRDGSIKALVS